MTQTNTPGAVRAAERIDRSKDWIGGQLYKEWLSEVIDEETRAAELLAFIEKVAEGLSSGGMAQTEATALIKKAKGEV